MREPARSVLALFLVLISATAQAQNQVEWNVSKNGSARVYYSEGYKDFSELILSEANRELLKLTELLGISFNGEVFIFIVSDDKTWNRLTNGAIPDWSGGVTKSRSGIVYLRLEKNFREKAFPVLRHELVHVVLGKNFPQNSIPRWFEEGVSMLYSRGDISDYSTALSWANLSNSLLSLPEIDDVLLFNRGKANLAYAQSYLGAKMIVDAMGWEGIRRILAGIAEGQDWSDAFATVLEMDEKDFEWHLQDHVNRNFRWYFLYRSDFVLWVIIPSLVIISFLVVRIRRHRTYRRWMEDEETEIADQSPYEET